MYGCRRVHDDLRDPGETCGQDHVYRPMRLAGLEARIGYTKRPGHDGGKPAVVAPITLERQLDPVGPNQAWATDSTLIRIYQGWRYLGIILDPYPRQVVGWSMQARIHAGPVLKGLLMAV